MKSYTAIVALLLPMSASAFMVASVPRQSTLPAYATPAKTAEEDLELTRSVIRNFLGETSENAPESAPAPTPAAESESKEE